MRSHGVLAALAFSLVLAPALQAAQVGGGRSVAANAPQWAGALRAFFDSPAPDLSAMRGFSLFLSRIDLADPAAVQKLEPVVAQLQAAGRRFLTAPPSAGATEADLLAASQKLALLNTPAFRNLLTQEQQARVGAVAWAYNKHLIEDIRADSWKLSSLGLAEKIEGIAKALEASGAVVSPPEQPALAVGPGPAVKLSVRTGDVSLVKTDALIATVQLAGFCHGGINAMIERLGGGGFRKQVEAAKPLSDGQAVVTLGDRSNQGKFKNVVFVIDDMRLPLRRIVLEGLRAADKAGFASVTLPSIRTGYVFGYIEKTYQEIVLETLKGLAQFLLESRKSVKKITFVVHNNPALAESLKQAVTP